MRRPTSRPHSQRRTSRRPTRGRSTGAITIATTVPAPPRARKPQRRPPRACPSRARSRATTRSSLRSSASSQAARSKAINWSTSAGRLRASSPSRTTRSGLHGYYYLQVAPGDTIEIVSDLGEMDAPAWPWVKPGDSSTVRGRYYYDSASSQGIDWTHHGASRSWPNPGYVVIDGTEYR